MDFEDELPCGGYQQEDKKIENNLQQLSLQSDGLKPKKQNNCNAQCTCSCNKEKCQSQHKDIKKEQKILAPKKKIICKKCKQNQAVLIHKSQQICKDCLLKNIEYKTRLTLQNKIKITSKQKAKLLICFSGGLNSICLVQIISNIKKRYQKSPLFGEVQCIHIKQQQKLPEGYEETFQKMTDFKLTVIPIQKIYKKQDKQFKDVTNLFKQFPKNTNTIDLLTLFRNKLIIQYAKLKKFDYILLAKNGQSLASQIFKYFTKGIGGNASQLSSSQPSIFEYPLRQHLQKQLQYYFYQEKLGRLSMIAEKDDLSHIAYNEIDSYLDQFIVNLQQKYSHTASAIVRTGEKIKNNFEQDKIKQCKWCWLKHDRDGNLCQKCLRLKQYINTQEKWSLMPEWTLGQK